MRSRTFFNNKQVRLLIGLLFVLLFLTMLQAAPANAAIMAITSTSDAVDANPGDGMCATSGGACTLRAAIQEANALSGADIINVPAGTYTITIPPINDNGADSGDFDITGPVVITGAGAASTILDGGQPPVGAPPEQFALDRLIEVHPAAGNVTFIGLTLREGYDAVAGGALFSASPGTVRLQNVSVLDSFATDFGGGIYNGGPVDCPEPCPAGGGRLELIDSTVSNNTTAGEGGGVANMLGTLTVSGGAITGNTARNGGGVYNAGELSEAGLPGNATFTNATISGNHALAGGGGIFGEHEGVLTLTNSTLSENRADDNGGGISAVSKSSLTINGGSFIANFSVGHGGGLFADMERATTINSVTFSENEAGATVTNEIGEIIVGEGGGGGFFAGGSGVISVVNSTFSANIATGDGGGILIASGGSVEISDSVVRDNTTDANGGGIENGGMGVTLTRLAIFGNTATLDGGGIESQGSSDLTIVDSNIYANTAENGGGFANAADGALLVSRTTFWDNRALVGTNDDTGLGGGIYSLGDAEALYENVTIAANFAQMRGGGLYVDADAPVHVASTTIAHNSAAAGSGVGGPITSINFPIEPSSGVIFRNTIVADNLQEPNCTFAIGSQGGNLDDGDTCYFRGLRDRTNAGSAGLDAVADNGGPTLTMALHPDSFAVDGGVSPCPATDQRGVIRPQNTACDMGAYEFEGPFPPPDTTPPDTQYLSGPIQDTEATSIFTFTGSDNVTAPEELLFECRLLESEAGEPPEPPDPTEPPDPELAFVGCPNPWQVPAQESGTFTFEVRAIDRAGNVDPTPAGHLFEIVLDLTPPDTFFLETPPNPSFSNTATFTFGATDDHTPPQFMEFECRIDTTEPEAWLECTNPTVFSNLTVGSHTVQVRAADGGDNIDPTPATYTWTVEPPLDCDAANITLTANADGFVNQESPFENFVLLPELAVRSGELATNARALFRFPLANDAPDCTLESATLRLYAAGSTPGRTLQAIPLAADWAENTVTWNNQPATSGAAIETSSGDGYREWDVTAQVADMLVGSLPNFGWQIRDAVEDDPVGGEQVFHSREAPQDPPTMTLPQLVLRFVADGSPPPPPPPIGTPGTVICGQVLFESIILQNDLIGCLGEGLVIGAPNIEVDLNGHTISSGVPIELGEEDGLLAGIRNGGHANVVIKNGTIKNFGFGVRLLAGAKYNVVEDMTLINNIIAGVELFDADDGRNGNIIHNNTFSLNGFGVALVSGSENSVVENNSFNGNLGMSVYLFNASGHRIESNIVSGITNDPLLDSDGGMQLDGSSDNLLLNNTVSDTGDAGIIIAAGSHRNLIEGNTLTRTGDAGVSLASSDDNEVVNNIAHLTADVGISLSGANGNLVSGNDVRFNPGGISLEASSGNLLQNNNANGSLGNGISLAGGSLDNHILNNLASNTNATGIAVEGEALDANGNPVAGNVIEGNTTNENLGSGISVAGAGHTVTANAAHNNAAWGIQAAAGTIDGGGNTASGNGEPLQCTGVVCTAGTAPPVSGADVTPPDTVITGQPVDGSSSLDPAVFTFTGSDDQTPVTALRFECRLDAPPDPEPDPPDPGELPEPVEGENWIECGSPSSYSFLLSGEHTFEVRARDPADNFDPTPATYTWTIVAAPPGPDSTPPSTTIFESPSDPSTSTSATFGFRGSDNATPGPDLTFQCRLDSTLETDFAACTSPTTYTGLSLGLHTFDVRAIDLAGNIDSTPATYTWTIVEPPPDITPPETTIDSGPDPTTVSTEASFTFSSNEEGSTFDCSLDGALFTACVSPLELNGLGVGPHTFAVQAIDPAGNPDPTPATYAWTVAPPTVLAAVSCGQVLTQSTLVTNDLLDCPENGLVIGAHGITLDLDGHIIDGTGLGAGILNNGFDSVTIRTGTVREFDTGVQLNPGSALNIVEMMSAQLNELAGIALSNADNGGNGNTIRHNTAGGNGLGIQLANGTQAALVHDNTVSGSSGLGLHVLNSSGNLIENNLITAVSDAGVLFEGASANTLIGNTVLGAADAAVILEMGSNNNRIESNSLTESEAGINILDSNGNELIDNVVHNGGDNGISLENAHNSILYGNDVRFNSGGIQLAGSSGNLVEANNASESSGNGIELGDGSINNQIILNQANGNDAEGISIGALAPPGSGNLIDRNTTNNNSADGIFVGDVGHIIVGNAADHNGGWGIYAALGTASGLNIDGGSNTAIGNVGGGLDPVTGLTIECFNVVCNGSDPLPADQVPPETVITQAPPDPTSFDSASFSFTGSDNATPVTFQCRLDSTDAADFVACASPFTYTGLSLGVHTFEVRAVDFSSNVDQTPATYTWTIEALPPGIAPDTTIDSAPDPTTASTSATFTFSANEPGATFDCALNGAAFSPCTSPQTYTGLAVGSHTFEVRAVDVESNVDPFPAVFSWTITAAPVATAVSCGQVLTQSTLVTNDLLDCAGNGLVIGAHAITVDLDGHTIDGAGLGVGILNNGFDSVTISNGFVQEFDFGLQLNPGTTLNVVSALTLQLNQEAGIQLSDADGNTIRNNDIVANGAGITLLDGTQDTLVRDNIISSSSLDGLLILNASGNRLEANTISLSSGAGILLEGAPGNTLVGNHLTGNSGEGLTITLLSHDNRVEANNITANAGGISIVESNGTEVINNIVQSNDSGISLEIAQNNLLAGNDVRFNAGGIALAQSTDNRLENNNASGNSGAGISLEGVSLNNEILFNTASGNAGEGIYIGDVAAAGASNLIEGNIASNNSGDGIFVAAGGHTVTANTADSNDGWGIFAEAGTIDGGDNRASGNAEPGQCSGIVCIIGVAPGAPDTELVDRPPDPSNSQWALFTFIGTDDTTPLIDLGFECRLDSTDPLAFLECENPQVYSGLAPGPHTFEVRAVDLQEIVDPTPVTYTWTYEPLPAGVAPDTFIDLAPPLASPLLEGIFTFSANEPDVTFECSLDGAAFALCAEIDPLLPPPTTGFFEFAFDETQVGPHTFQVRAVDFEGNADLTPATYNWTITGITTTITDGPAFVPPEAPGEPASGGETAETTATFEFFANVADATFVCSLDLGPFEDCESPLTYTGLAVGEHLLRIIASDPEGGVQLEPTEYEWVVILPADTIPPDTTITSAPADNSSDTVFTFTGTDDQTQPAALLFECRLDSTVETDFAECVSPFNLLELFPEFAPGTHTFEVRAIDAAEPTDPTLPEGNTDPTPASYTWTSVADTTPPETVILTGPPTTAVEIDVEFTFAGSDNATPELQLLFECSVDGAPFQECTSPESVQGLTGGLHEFQVRTVDLALNADPTPATYTWTVIGPPETTIDSGPATISTSTIATFTFSADQPGSTFVCALDGLVFVPCTSPVAYTGLANGLHLFEVQATNTFGLVDETPATYEWTVDAPLETTILSGPPALTASPDATFTFTANIPNSTFACSLDGAAFTPCTSPILYTGLVTGTHTFAVQATDPLGNTDPTPATYSWTIDTTVQPTMVSCGEVLVLNVLVLNDLTDCPANGLVIGTSGLTVDLDGHTIDGAGLVGVGTGILNNGFHSVTITNGAVQEFADGIALLTGAQNNVVSDVTLIGNLSIGIHLVDASGNQVEGNIVDGLLASGLPGSDSGILLEESSNNELLGNTVSGTGDAGIVLSADSDGNLVEGNILTNTGDAGIYLQDSDGNDLISNSAQGASDSGIGLENAHNNIVRLNNLSLNAVGIELLSSTGNLVENNSASDNGGHGIYVDGEAAAGIGNTLDGNIAERNGQDGINVAAAVHTIVSNSANDNLGWGIFAAPGNTDGGGNTASGNGQAGQCSGITCNAGPATTVNTTIDSGPAATTADTSATFTFSANEPTIQFECSLDGAPYAVCTSPHTVSGLAVGAHTLLVRAFDLDSIPDPMPALYSWTVLDSTPPETIITSGPPTTTVSTEATFIFAATETGSIFECSLDEAPFDECESPFLLTGLEVAAHSFAVRAIDLSGNIDPTPATYNWTVETDITPPDTVITAGPSGLNANVDVVFEFTGSDDGTLVLELEFECSLDGEPFSGCSSPHEVQGLEVGDHTFAVRAIDLALNVDPTPDTRTWTTVDVIAPDAAIDSGPADPTEITNASFTFSSDDPTATFDCSLDGAAFAVCTSPHEITGLSVALHTFQVRAVDPTGNADTTPDSYPWTVVDVNPPDTTITAGPTDPSPSAEAIFAFSSDQPNVTFECSLDGEPFAECESPHELQDLADGVHEFQVQAVDLLGKVDATPATYSWTVAVPNTPAGSDVAVVTTTPDNGTTASLTFEEVIAAGDTTVAVETTPPALPDGYLQLGSLFYDVNTTATFTGFVAICLSYNPADFADPAALTLLHYVNGAWEDVTISNDTDTGELCGEVTSLSPFGIAAPTTTVPETTIESEPPATTTDTTAIFTFSATESGATFACSLDGMAFITCTSPVTYSELAAGSHTFEVYATNAAGNPDPTPAGYIWTVEPVTADCGSQLTLSADADAWIDQGSPSSNKGDDSILKVMSKGSSSNLRALVRFGMPTSIPDGCIVESATLRLYAASWASGRTLQTLQVSGAWTESGVTWNNQPTTTGAAATTSSGQGYREWNVAAQVQAIYDTGANHGFLIRDATENQDAEQQFHSREKGETMPQLVITFTPAPATDTTPPNTAVTSGPADPTTDTSATFTFSAGEPGSTFACSLDGAAFNPCSSSVNYTGLSLGEHTFAVRATDGAGNTDSTPASYTWTVESPPTDTPEPTATDTPEPTDTPTAEPTATDTPEPTATDTPEPTDTPTAEPTATDTPEPTDTPTAEPTATDTPEPTNTPTPEPTATPTPAPDTTPPDTAVISGPDDPTTHTSATFTFAANEPGSTFECSLDGADFTACASPASYTNLSLGEHTFAVRATDGAGNTNPTPASYTWNIVSPPTPTPEPTETPVPPTPTPVPPTATNTPTETPVPPTPTPVPPTATNTPTETPVPPTATPVPPTATNTPTETPVPPTATNTPTAVDCGAPMTVSTNGDAWINQGSPTDNKGDDSILKVMSKSGGDNLRALVNFPMPQMPAGCVVDTATLRIYADSASSGRTLQAFRLASSWSENNVTWNNQPSTTGTAATTTSGSGWREWAVASQVQAMYDTAGHHGFLIRDAVENQDNEQQLFSREKGENPPQLIVTFIALGDLPPDETAPETTLVTWPSSTTTSISASFTFWANEPGATYECSLDTSPFSACSSPAEYTALSVGSHTFAVRATDQAGNVDTTPASYGWTIEEAPPAVDCGAPVTVLTHADAWIDRGSTSSNKGDDSILKVTGKGSNSSTRALVQFALPTDIPAGCIVESATLRLYAASWKNNRTLRAYQLNGSWTEYGVTWNNQPSTTGSAVTTNSGSGWRQWNVTAMVQTMVNTGVNNGFLIRDANESGSGAEQQFHAREKNENTPELVITFAQGG